MRRLSLPPRPTAETLARRAAVAVHGEPPNGGLELLVWLGGEGDTTLAAAAATLDAIAGEASGGAMATALLFDRADWVAPLAAQRARLPVRRELVLERATALPALLLERAIATSSAATFAFAWPGTAPSGAALEALARHAAESGAPLVHGDLPAGTPGEGAGALQHGLLRMADLVPMHHCVLTRDGWRLAGGFDRSPVLRRAFWWDLAARLSRRAALAHAPVPPSAPPRWSWAALPLGGEDPADADLAARWVARLGEARRDLAGDLPDDVRRRLAANVAAWHDDRGLRPSRATGFRAPSPRRSRRDPLRVTLVCHLLDAHQCDLYFHTSFARTAGRGRLSWRTVPYEGGAEEALAGADLLVLVRPRFAPVRALLDGAERRRLPVLVMIDDNWIAAGREYPRFAELFTPGRPAFESFLEALRRAAATLVFNEVLEEDVRPHARRVLRLPPSLEPDLYAAARRRGAAAEGLVVAYAGSPRWDPAAFTGLASFLEETPAARLVLMAHEVPHELRSLDPRRIDFRPWQHHYEAYAAALGAAAPDVLLAPLDGTRFSASKVPLKWLEAGAVGAAPVLSRVAPYTRFVRDGESGLLVANEPDAWRDALRRLAADDGLRRRLARAARGEVRERFATARVLPAFLAALEEVARGPA